MLYLANVFQFIVNSLYNGSFSEQYFVGHGHQTVLHVISYTCNKLNTINKEELGKFFANIAFVCEEFAEYFVQEVLLS